MINPESRITISKLWMFIYSYAFTLEKLCFTLGKALLFDGKSYTFLWECEGYSHSMVAGGFDEMS